MLKNKLATLLVAVGSVLFFVGCSFDPAALNSRSCDDSDPCGAGQVCVAGYCQSTLETIGDTGIDTGNTDLGDVNVGEACEGFAPSCEGDQVVRCEDGRVTRTSCQESSECTSPTGCYCLSGTCLPRVCTPGTTRCNGEVTEVCDEQGAGFVLDESCADGDICLAGTCLPRDCVAGSVECIGERLVTCGNDGQVAAATDCSAEGAFCADDGDIAGCIDQVCEPGSSVCDGTAILTCDDRGSVLARTEDCGPDQTCLDGACAERLCEPGADRCANIFTIARCDETGALEVEEACGSNQYCASSISGAVTCEEQVCEPDTFRCVEGTENRQQCSIDGSSYLAPEPCAGGTYCAAGQCLDWECTPGATQCDGDFGLLVCNSRGTAQDGDTCDSGTYCDGADGVATCRAQSCTPGNRRCASLQQPEVCDSRGAGYVDADACAANQSCDAGSCVDRICSPGTTRCSDITTVANCADNGLSETSITCGTDQFCDDGACTAQVCTPGTSVCSGDFAVETCDSFGSSTSISACPASQFCSAGQCEPQVCEPDVAVCAGQSVAQCNSIGSLVAIVNCGPGRTCLAGACVDEACSPSSRSCASPVSVLVCNALGTGSTVEDCPAGEICDAGSCEPQVCTPDTSTCIDDTTRSVCDEFGASISPVACPAGQYCSAGACVPQLCTPGALVCSGNTARECNAAGSGYINTPCGDTNYCLAGECLPRVCTPNAVVCSDVDTVSTCNGNGSSETLTDCGPDQFCDAGVCQDQTCTPGEVVCAAGNVTTCNEAGSQFEVTETCTDGCDAGACITPPGCGDGILQPGEECDDNNSNDCDSCVACTIQNVGNFSAATVRTGGGSWVPGNSDFTIEGWVRVTGPGTLMGIGNAAVESEWAFIFVTNTNELAFGMDIGANQFFIVRPGNFVDSQWHHVAAVRYDDNDAMLFVDGRLAAIGGGGGSFNSLDGSGALYVGGINGGFPGASARIDNVRFSNIERYTRGFTPARTFAPDANTIALYEFNEASLTTVVDSSGQGRNLSYPALTPVGQNCLGQPSSYACGDGQVAPWEACDGGGACNGSCLTTCPGGAVRGPFAQCYIPRDNNDDWVAHRDACRSGGRDLITINNAVENRWLDVFDVLTNNYWIGYNDRASEGNFVWSSGSTSTYTNWANNEPNDRFGEDCAEFLVNGGEWNDGDCDTNRRAVCE